ncbi:MAG: hypothetical protein Q7S28_03455 [bacterium]|nr:hypothetical protein [bacterium]
MPRSKKTTAVQEIIDQSGNSFHSCVVKNLRDGGWTVLVSPYYSDNFTDKPREIDIIAEKKFNVTDFVSNWLGTVNVLLFIECKYITTATVFWFDAKDKERAIERIMRDTGMEHPQLDGNIQKHHYLSDVAVAKLFASDSKRNEDNETITKAINQNLNATVYYRNRKDLKIATTQSGYVERVLKRVSYPIIVVNSMEPFHSTDMGGSGEVHAITEPFQLEVNYAYTDKDRNGFNEYFLVDVVSIDKLSDFLITSIEQADVPALAEKIKWDKRLNRAQN